MVKELLTVAIVDDEYLIRELLEKRVNWEELGCRVVLKASSALEVYDYVDEYPLDILITDINMPIINGITMAKKIKNDYPHIKVVVLTGYNDFEYARSGIDIGIEGYLLKPINPSEIQKVLKKVILSIKSELEKKIAYESLLKRINEEKEYMRERIFIKMISQKLSISKIKQYGNVYDISVHADFHQIAIIDFILLNHDDLSEKDHYPSMLKGKMILEDLILNKEKKDKVYIFSDVNNRLYIYNTDADFNLLEELRYFIKINGVNNSCDVQIGVSLIKDDIQLLHQAYLEAKEALQLGVIQGHNKICSFEEANVLSHVSMDELYFDKELDDLRFFIKSGLKNEAKEVVNQLFDYISQSISHTDNHKISFLRIQITRIISNLKFLVLSLNKEIQANLSDSKRQALMNDITSICQLETISMGQDYIIETVSDMIDTINHYKNHIDNDRLDEIDNYIVEHLSSPELSLKNTAKYFYMNSSYLSRIYKKKRGVSFKERMIKLRMEKGVELLRNKDLKVYEVANQVGIIDANYFSVCFKKYMNMSISEYRKKLLME